MYGIQMEMGGPFGCEDYAAGHLTEESPKQKQAQTLRINKIFENTPALEMIAVGNKDQLDSSLAGRAIVRFILSAVLTLSLIGSICIERRREEIAASDCQNHLLQ